MAEQEKFGIDGVLKFGTLFGAYFFFQGYSYSLGLGMSPKDINFYSMIWKGTVHLSALFEPTPERARPIVPWISGLLLLYIPFLSDRIKIKSNRMEASVVILFSLLFSLSVIKLNGFLLGKDAWWVAGVASLALWVGAKVWEKFKHRQLIGLPTFICAAPWRHVITCLMAGLLFVVGVVASFDDGCIDANRKDKECQSILLS